MAISATRPVLLHNLAGSKPQLCLLQGLDRQHFATRLHSAFILQHSAFFHRTGLQHSISANSAPSARDSAVHPVNPVNPVFSGPSFRVVGVRGGGKNPASPSHPISAIFMHYISNMTPLALAIPLCCKSLIINDELILVSTMPKKDIPKSLSINTVADVTTLLRFLLRVKCLSANDVADVTDSRRTYTFHYSPSFCRLGPAGGEDSASRSSPEIDAPVTIRSRA